MNTQFVKIVKQTIVVQSHLLNPMVATEVRMKIHSFESFEPVVTDFSIDLSQVEKAYANGVMPIISEVRRLRSLGFAIGIIPPRSNRTFQLFEKQNWLHFLEPEKFKEQSWETIRGFPLQRFTNDEELNDIVSKAVVVCMEQLGMQAGTPQAFEWALNEIAGNVLVHSESKEGFLQVTTFNKNHMLTIGVCDGGIGIPEAMSRSFPGKTDKEEIELAIRQGVTSNPENGQGNGLAGAIALAEASKGSLDIVSGSALVSIHHGQVRIDDSFPPFQGTFVDMQLATNIPVDLPKALWGHEPTSMIELNFENSEGESALELSSLASSFGNRITGAKIRTFIINLLQNNPGKPVKISFLNVGIISSSFADEVFGKLILDLGVIEFGRLIRMENINPTIVSIINRTIAQRLAQSVDHVTPNTRKNDKPGN